MTYQIPVFVNGARGSAAFFFVFFNPIKYTDPDGRSPKSVLWKAAGVLAYTGAGAIAVVTIVIVLGSEGAAFGIIPGALDSIGTLAALGTTAFIIANEMDKASPIGPTITETRQKNWLPESGVPGSVVWDPSGIRARKYGADGYPELDWNAPHPDADPNSSEAVEHVHRWEPRASNSPVPGKGSRGDPEPANQNDKNTFKQNSQPTGET